MIRLLVALSMLICSYCAHAAVWVVTYPKPLYEGDQSNDYPVALLALALDKTKVRYELNPSLAPMRQDRAIRRLEENLDINVYWTVTDINREEDLLPIRIPITKGLIGWRMFLAHKNNAFLSAPLETLENLRAFTPVQGIGWTDTKVLQANGFDVMRARNYEEAKLMVNQQLADMFPRSVIEIQSELLEDGNANLRLRDDIALQYASAMYFFVNKTNITLAKLLQTGLERAVADGSFDALFLEHFGDTLKSLNIETLRTFELGNTVLPSATPMGEQAYWFSAGDLSQQISEPK